MILDYSNSGPPEYRVLSIQRSVIAVFADHGVDHDLVAIQALLDDSGRHRRRDHALFLARLTRTFSRLLTLFVHWNIGMTGTFA